jgi:tRNA A37 threonylcarbamoyladenosine biosynthesis protein TsaE
MTTKQLGNIGEAKALAKLVNPNSTVTPNVVYINGVAGAGKTEVVLKNIR